MPFNSYSQINSLEETTFIAGNDFTLEYAVYESDGITPMDLGGATSYCLLSPYGQPDYNEVQITATITGANTFEADITSLLSKDLSGYYIHQPVIVAFSGTEYRPAQGLLNILPRTPIV